MICNFYLSVAARKIVSADPSLRYTSMLLGRSANNQQTNICVRRRAPTTHLVALLHGQGVEDGLDGAQGLVAGPLFPRVAGEGLHELVGVQQHLVNVQLVAHGGQHAHHLPQTLWAGTAIGHGQCYTESIFIIIILFTYYGNKEGEKERERRRRRRRRGSRNRRMLENCAHLCFLCLENSIKPKNTETVFISLIERLCSASSFACK